MDARVSHGVQVMEQTVPSWEGVNGSGPQRGGWGRLEHFGPRGGPATTYNSVSVLGQELDALRLLDGSDQPIACLLDWMSNRQLCVVGEWSAT